uniref:GRIP domain-containing protein n=1 Tax=Strongyloides papillosus TaxID=174720 RepID=A0A0N5BPQ3_STREA
MDDLSLTLEASTFLQEGNQEQPQNRYLGELVHDNDKLRRENESMKVALEQLRNALFEVEKYKGLEDKGELIVNLTERCRRAESDLEKQISEFNEEKKKMSCHIENLTAQNNELKRDVVSWKNKHANAEIETKILNDKLNEALSVTNGGCSTIDESEKVKALEKDIEDMKSNYENVIDNLNKQVEFSKANVDCLTVVLSKFFEKYNVISQEGIENFGLEDLGARRFLEEEIILSCGGKSVSNISLPKVSNPPLSFQNDSNNEGKNNDEKPVRQSSNINLDETINLLSKTFANASMQREIDMNLTHSGMNNLFSSLLLMKELLERMFAQLRSAATVIIDTLKADGTEVFKELNDLMLQIQISVDTTINDASVLVESVNQPQSNTLNLTKMMNQTLGDGNVSVSAGNALNDDPRYEELKTQTDKLKEETNELKEKLSQALERVSTNNSKLFEQTTKLRAAEEQIKTLETALSDLEAEKEGLSLELNDYKTKFEELEMAAKEYTELLLSLNNERDVLIQDIDSKTAEVDLLSGQNEVLKKEVEEIRSRHDVVASKLQQLENEKENVMSHSQSALLSTSSSSIFDISRSDIGDNVVGFDDLKKAVNEAKHYVNKLSEYVTKKEAAVNDVNVKHVLNNIMPVTNKILMRLNIASEKVTTVQQAFNIYTNKIISSADMSEEKKAKLSSELKAIVSTLRDVAERSNVLFKQPGTQ